MSNTVITNYTDLNGPSTKADNSVVVIVNKDGSLSVDQSLLGTLMGTDGSQGAGISVVRVGHEGRPDDATDSESDDEKVPHVTLSVDSYYGEPNSIIKYDSGAEMLQSLRIETRENSLVGFQNDHCYTPLTSPSQGVPQRSDSYSGYDEPVIEITHTPPPKPVPQAKKITILEQQIIPKGKKNVINPTESASSVLLKSKEGLNKSSSVQAKAKQLSDQEKSSDNSDSSSISSGDSIPDRDSDSDYKDTKDRSLRSVRKSKLIKPRILKHSAPAKGLKLDSKAASRLKSNKNLIRRDIREKIQQKAVLERKQSEPDLLTSKESLLQGDVTTPTTAGVETGKVVHKQTPKPVRKEKKPPAHMTALLSDMTSLFSTPDVIRRVSTEAKTPAKPENEPSPANKKPISLLRTQESIDTKLVDSQKVMEDTAKTKTTQQRTYVRQKDKPSSADKVAKVYDLIPQLDDAALAQILQDTTGMSTSSTKTQSTINVANTINSPGLAGPLSPTLDLLGGLQPEEEGLTEDLLMHVAQLVESSENLQEVIDKQVLGKVDTIPPKPSVQSPFQQQSTLPYSQTPTKAGAKTILPRKDPIEIVRRDGRVITLPPIEAPATRSSKRKSQMETSAGSADAIAAPPAPPAAAPPSPAADLSALLHVSKQYVNKKLNSKKQEQAQAPVVDKVSAESQESWNSEDDPYRLWCICKQPHNNRFMICCDGCEDWFHGKCVNITKAMGQQMEEQGIEWRCPNCVKKTKTTPKSQIKQSMPHQKKHESEEAMAGTPTPGPAGKDGGRTGCIVCRRAARASSIYCSDACILKHAQDSLGPPAAPAGPGQPDKHKGDSRVIVYERKTGRLLAGPNAPTAENLKTWLQKNPTFEVVRPGTLHTIKPNLIKRKSMAEGNKIQTTLNFAKIPRKSSEQAGAVRTPPGETRARGQPAREEPRATPPAARAPPPAARVPPPAARATPPAARATPPAARAPPPATRAPAPAARTPAPAPAARVPPTPAHADPPRPSTSAPRAADTRKPVRPAAATRSHSYDKAPAVSPSTSRRKEAPEPRRKMDSTEPIRENVRKSLHEQMSIRMSESKTSKFTEDEIQQFAVDTEIELHELFGRDVGMKYKAKYRSLMFNIKDRKNLSLWHKICDRKITPAQLVRLSPEEMASQELAQWREDETKHQLELIKKSELDLLAANKTYVLKTHKGEEVMEKKDSVQTELDPEVPIEDVVIALNDSTVGEEVTNQVLLETTESKHESKEISSKKRDKTKSSTRHSKKSSRESKRDSESRKSRSSRRRSEREEREDRSTRHPDKKSKRAKSLSKERKDKEKSDSSERERPRRRSRSRSRTKGKRRSKSRERSRSASAGRSRKHSADPRRSQRPRRAGRDLPRARSHDHAGKPKHDSTDSDSVERPKSATLKEVHPEYDPHEPMITSAFSEEDLRKSGGDSFDDSYKNDIVQDYTDPEFDPTNSFTIDTSIVLPAPSFIAKMDKVSETESDQEPSSTVENSAATVWNGCINMVDVARFYVAAHEVSGNCADLEEDLSAELDIVGRINPDTVWEYIGKMKRTSNKDIVILRLQAANDEEKMQYIALYSYLSSRNRLGVVRVASAAAVKDLYVVPLGARCPLPAALLPLDGAPIDNRTHLLLAIVIRQRRKRPAANIPTRIVPAKVGRDSRKRSYTPPLAAAPPATATPPPARVPLPASFTSPALSTSVKDKIAASLAAADDEEAYSPGSSSSSGSAPPPAAAPAPPADKLLCKVEELNRQIEEQKQQILKMAQADSSVAGEDEAYSPSRPMTPPSVVPLADISLPSNLQEILATIKQRETTTTDVDMRNLPLPP